MKLSLIEVTSGQSIDALIAKAKKSDLPLKQDGWQFSWKQLGRIKGANLYKLITLENPEQVEGMLMLSLINEEMLYMNNIEVAPQNRGEEGRLANVAGGLIAFACYKSFELGKEYYTGFLSFDSKSELIRLYREKYGATLAIGQKMFFDPEAGKALMKKYLSINLE